MSEMISSGDLVRHIDARGFGLWNKRRFQSTEQDRIRVLVPGELALVICLFSDAGVGLESTGNNSWRVHQASADDKIIHPDHALTYVYVLVLVSDTCELGWTDIHAWELP